MRGVLDGDRGAKDAFDVFIEALSSYARQDKLVEGTHYAYVAGKLCIHLESCHDVYLAERTKTSRGDDTNGLPALQRIIREKIEAGGYVKRKDHRVKLGDEAVRTVEIAVEEVPEALRFERFPKNHDRVHGGRRENPRGIGYQGFDGLGTGGDGEEPNFSSPPTPPQPRH